ncbi:hypothetical protein KYI11_10940 [Macrococcoides bohemicum]|uniref:Uncharacterized protein n=1 Tax=Macrococcoides bohemicum TaxID=1903056 RepID=A0AAJ4PAI5_9STAP|nr:hypothetical protein [Macrococcus bohemicus]QYA42099.1 hypothetical protein KYI11_10940 [Macrococcus bohemicus]
MILEKVFKLVRPEKKLQVDTFEWYEKGRWVVEVIKCKSDKKIIYLDSGFNNDTEKYFIDYYNK